MQDLLHEVCVRVGVRYVITKFSRMDSLPNFLTHGAALRARARAPLKFKFKLGLEEVKNILFLAAIVLQCPECSV